MVPVRPLAATAAGALVSATLLFGATAATAQTCDAYSGGCASRPRPRRRRRRCRRRCDRHGRRRVADPDGDGTACPRSTRSPAAATRVTRPAVNRPATLPFTGGELVLLSAVGLGALATGSVLVVAGRRRTSRPDAAA